MEFVNAGDEVIVTELEHHSNLIPWMNVCKKKGATLKYVPLTKDGRITVENFKSVISSKTKVVAINHVSNVMGYIAPIKEIVEIAHQYGAVVSVDGAQAIPHMKVDVKELGCDFYSFSGHKMCGPTGVGVLYGKKEILDKMEPIEFGGDMADEVFKNYATYKDTPYKFETGTPIIAEAIALAEACLYLNEVGYDYISKHEHELKELALEELLKIDGIEIYNPTCETGIITFNVAGVHPHDAASVFDKNDVCIRAGHHCAQPITHFLGQMSTIRASFYFYNDAIDVRKFVETVKEAVEFFGQF
jgi:cysteine desulfurase/selenocysteine lyase